MAYLKTIGICGIVLFLLTIAVYSDIDRILFQDKEYFVFGINLPSFWSFKLDGPCLIGEYGQKTNVWDDSLQNTADTLLMNNAWSKGFGST